MIPYLLVNENFVNWCRASLEPGSYIVSEPLLRFGNVYSCVQIDWQKHSETLCNDDWCWENDVEWHEILSKNGEGGSNCSWDQHPYEPNNARRDGIFNWIIEKTGASTTKNVAAVLGDIWRFEGASPIKMDVELHADRPVQLVRRC